MKNATVIKEMMENYNKSRKEWVRQYGTDAGFDKWFTNQVTSS